MSNSSGNATTSRPSPTPAPTLRQPTGPSPTPMSEICSSSGFDKYALSVSANGDSELRSSLSKYYPNVRSYRALTQLPYYSTLITDVQMGLSFPFYHGRYTALAVSANGFVTFARSLYPGISSTAHGIPSSDLPELSIAALHADMGPLDPQNSGMFAGQLNATTYAVVWQNWVARNSFATGLPGTYELILHTSGQFWVNFVQPTALSSSTIRSGNVPTVGVQMSYTEGTQLCSGSACLSKLGYSSRLLGTPVCSGTVALSGGAIVGITLGAIGGFLLFVAAVVACTCCCIVRGRRRKPVHTQQYVLGSPVPTVTYSPPNADYSPSAPPADDNYSYNNSNNNNNGTYVPRSSSRPNRGGPPPMLLNFAAAAGGYALTSRLGMMIQQRVQEQLQQQQQQQQQHHTQTDSGIPTVDAVYTDEPPIAEATPVKD